MGAAPELPGLVGPRRSGILSAEGPELRPERALINRGLDGGEVRVPCGLRGKLCREDDDANLPQTRMRRG